MASEFSHTKPNKPINHQAPVLYLLIFKTINLDLRLYNLCLGDSELPQTG